MNLKNKYDNFIHYLENKRPELKKNIKMAREQRSPRELIEEGLKLGFMMALTVTFILLLVFNKAGIPLLLLLPLFPVLVYGFYNYRLLSVKAKIITRRKEIDKDVLFAGRYLLVQLNSGKPIVSAIGDAANSYGMANKYFKEIMNDIDMGRPTEEALSEAAEYSPSKKFRKIIFQIANAMKIGVDVTQFLRSTLEEIIEDQIVEIKRYGKKLNSVTLFYLLVGIVIPSLGMTLATIGVSIAFNIPEWVFYGGTLLGLILLQSIFLITYRQIRPNLNI